MIIYKESIRIETSIPQSGVLTVFKHPLSIVSLFHIRLLRFQQGLLVSLSIVQHRFPPMSQLCGGYELACNPLPRYDDRLHGSPVTAPRQLRIVHICAAPSPGPTSAQRHPAWSWKTEDGEDGRQHNTMTFIFQSPATSTSRPPRQPGHSKLIQIQIKNKLNERHKHYLMPSLQILS